MKKLIIPALLGFASLAWMPTVNAQAAAGFNVTVTLTAVCEFTTFPGNMTVAYTSFSTTDVDVANPFAVRCTSSLPYTMALNTANADAFGLTIPLTIRNGANNADISGSQTGTGSAVSYNVRALLTAPQTGTCTTGSCTSTVGRTLTVSY